jgi:hypothetical protein
MPNEKKPDDDDMGLYTLNCEDCGALIDNYWDGLYPALCFKCWRDRD